MFVFLTDAHDNQQGLETFNGKIDIQLDEDGFGKLSALVMERSNGHVENTKAFLLTGSRKQKTKNENKTKNKQTNKQREDKTSTLP